MFFSSFRDLHIVQIFLKKCFSSQAVEEKAKESSGEGEGEEEEEEEQ